MCDVKIIMYVIGSSQSCTIEKKLFLKIRDTY